MLLPWVERLGELLFVVGRPWSVVEGDRLSAVGSRQSAVG